MQSFKKIDIKLYEELQSQGSHCLYIRGQKMTMSETKKVSKINARIISKADAHLQTMEKHVQSLKKDW